MPMRDPIANSTAAKMNVSKRRNSTFGPSLNPRSHWRLLVGTI